MTKQPSLRIVELTSERKSYDYRTPMKFGGRVVKQVVLQQSRVILEDKSLKKKSAGIGEMTLGTAWAWPSKTLSPEQVQRIVIALCDRVAESATKIEFGSHPIEFGMRLKAEAGKVAKELAEVMKLTEPIPDLAVMLACSSIDAAVHDAFGRMHNRSSFACMTKEFLPQNLDTLVRPGVRGDCTCPIM